MLAHVLAARADSDVPGSRKRNPNGKDTAMTRTPWKKEAQGSSSRLRPGGGIPSAPPETKNGLLKEKTMPLIVEDGTLPARANSFASVADADAHHAARLTTA